MNGGRSWKTDPITTCQKTLAAAQPPLSTIRALTDLLVPFRGHGEVEAVEDVVDLLALHLRLHAGGEEAVAGLRKAAWLAQGHQECTVVVPHLSFDLHDPLLRQRARLHHEDPFSRQVPKDFLEM